MAELIKGFAGRWTFLLSWALPAAIAIGSFTVIVIPRLRDMNVGLVMQLYGWTPAADGLVLLFASVALGFIMAAISTPLYRPLEGYSLWPIWLRQRGVRRQLKLKSKWKFRTSVRDDNAPDDTATLAVRRTTRALAEERLKFFPLSDNDVVATGLGNAIRAFETYGWERYGLDSQAFWADLAALSPKSLQAEVEHSRAAVDFFVATFYLGPLLGLSIVAVALAERYVKGFGLDLVLLIVGVGILLIVPFMSYHFAIKSTGYWRETVRAVVNLGRSKLARAMGLEWPVPIERERAMWKTIKYFVATSNTIYLNNYLKRVDDVRNQRRRKEFGEPEKDVEISEADHDEDDNS